MIRTTRTLDTLAQQLASSAMRTEGDSRLDQTERWRQLTTGRADSGRMRAEHFSSPGFLVLHRREEECIIIGGTIIAKVIRYVENELLTLEIVSQSPLPGLTLDGDLYKTKVSLHPEQALLITLGNNDKVSIKHGSKNEYDMKDGAKLLLDAPKRISIVRDNNKTSLSKDEEALLEALQKADRGFK